MPADWEIFKKNADPHFGISRLPPAPSWRAFARLDTHRGETYEASDAEVEAVNAALYLRRPLLVTGPPGGGKSSLAYAVARQLQLGPVLRWSISSRSTLQEGLYQYDAIARLRDANLELRAAREGGADLEGQAPAAERRSEAIGRYIRLGPLGTALLPQSTPRVLLIDEIDKSDIDLPNDLLHVFEEGRFEIPELSRIATEQPEVTVSTADQAEEGDARIFQHQATITNGWVRCSQFPFVLLTSNGERDLPPAFNRRCLRLDLQAPDPVRLRKLVENHLGAIPPEQDAEVTRLITEFAGKRTGGLLATDQLLNLIYMVTCDLPPSPDALAQLKKVLLRDLKS